MSDFVEDIPDLYESEKKTAQLCLGALQRKYATVGNFGDPEVQKRFIREAKGLYAENGLVVTVDIEPTCSDEPDDMNLYFVPDIKVVGRVDKLAEFDHDQQKHEIRNGVFDGVKGVIDPNTGQMKDDPSKKLIT